MPVDSRIAPVERREDERELVLKSLRLEVHLEKEWGSATVCCMARCWRLSYTPNDFYVLVDMARRVKDTIDLWFLESELGIRGYEYVYIYPDGKIEPSDGPEEVMKKIENGAAWVLLNKEEVEELGVFWHPHDGRLVIYIPEGTDIYEWRLYVDDRLWEVIGLKEEEHRKHLEKLLEVVRK